MSQQVVQNAASVVTVLLTLDNEGVEGLTDTDVTLVFRLPGEAFQALVLDGDNWTEVSDGYYDVSFAEGDLDVVGTMMIKITSADADTSYTSVNIVAADDEGITTVGLQTCILTGHIFDAMGEPVANAAVGARPIGLPAIEQSTAAITDDLVSTTTDANGQFFLTLIRLADVEVFIPVANFRRRIVVPNQASADLFSVS